MLTVRDLSFTVNGAAVLDAVSFSLADGEILAVIGPSGAGKSSLLSSLTGKLPFRGMAVSDAETSGKHPNMLLYPSTRVMREEESVYQTVLSGRAAYKRFFYPFSQFDIQTAEDMISCFGLENVRERQLDTLPDSIYKMTLLAHHAAYGAQVLMLDNPEEGLAICSRMRLIRALKKYVFEGKRSIIIATNDLNFASQSADRFLVLKDGKTVTSGGPEIITEELIRTVFECEGIVSRNIYNGRPEITLIPEA